MSAKANMSTKVTKFCKVCFDAGKSEKEYTNHYVRRDREPNSPVVCPTLLNQECGFCGKLGHSPKYCTVLEDKKKQDAKKEKMLKREQQKQQQPKPAVAATKATKPTASNVFAALYDSDDEEPKPKPVAEPALKKDQPALKKEQFPALQQQEQQAAKAATKKPAATNTWLKSLQQSCPNLTVPKQMAKETFINASAQPKATLVRPKQEEQEQAQSCPQPIFVSDFLEADEAFAPPPRQKASQMNWAEVEDPDSDDEDW